MPASAPDEVEADSCRAVRIKKTFGVLVQEPLKFPHRDEAEPATADNAHIGGYVLPVEIVTDADRLGGFLNSERESRDGGSTANPSHPGAPPWLPKRHGRPGR